MLSFTMKHINGFLIIYRNHPFTVTTMIIHKELLHISKLKIPI